MLSCSILRSPDPLATTITLQLFDDTADENPVDQRILNIVDLTPEIIEDAKNALIRSYLQKKDEKAERIASIAAALVTISPVLEEYRGQVEITQEEIDIIRNLEE